MDMPRSPLRKVDKGVDDLGQRKQALVDAPRFAETETGGAREGLSLGAGKVDEVEAGVADLGHTAMGLFVFLYVCMYMCVSVCVSVTTGRRTRVSTLDWRKRVKTE